MAKFFYLKFGFQLAFGGYMSDEYLKVAIIGAGPAGYYTAEALSKNNDNIRVDVLEQLLTPFGLIRGGVAPDHQSIKGVARRYEKTALQYNIRFIGNINIGNDITLDELRELYDAVIIATGAGNDRPLTIPGSEKQGVIGSAAFVGWYNSHPYFNDLGQSLDVDAVAVIGNGNVAVDVARVLAKTAEEMGESDLAPHAAAAIHPNPVKDIWMFGRRGPIEGNFTHKELGEFGVLDQCVAIAKPDQIPDDIGDVDEKAKSVKTKNLGHLQTFATHKPVSGKTTLHFEFYAQPVEILGDDKVEGIRLERTQVIDGKAVGTGEMFDVPCQVVIPCIGYRSEPLEGATFNEGWGSFEHTDGVIEPGLYVTGWARRGPSGTIGTNRPDAIEVANSVLENHKPSDKLGRPGLEALIEKRNLNFTTFKDWKKIEEAELIAGEYPAPRKKFATTEEMLEILQK
jgi:ferredoxin--NADP+ reductase